MPANNQYPLHAPPVFVCGVQRSGTTLLVRMLSRQPGFRFLPQETHYFPLFWNPKDNLGRFGSPKAFAAIMREQLPAVNYGWKMAEDFLAELTASVGSLDKLPGTTAGLMRYTMHLWQQKQDGKIRTGEKTPAHIYYAPKILKEFPECKIVLMCRDPRAAALSEFVKLKNGNRSGRKFSAFNFIVRWATAVALMHRYNDGRTAMLVRYEDLIANPRPTLEKLTGFLGMEMTEDMLEVGVTNSSFSDKKQKGIGFNTANLDRWREELDPKISALIDYHLKDDMRALGYEPQSDPADISAFPLVKQKTKLIAARKICRFSPARFHHYNRNRKYRFAES